MSSTIPKFLILCLILWVSLDSYLLVNVYYLDMNIIMYITQVLKYCIMFIPVIGFLFKYPIRKKAAVYFILYNCLLIIFCFIGFAKGYDHSNIILSIKNVYLWLWFSLLLCCFDFTISDKYVKYIFFVFLISAIINVIYSIYISVIFDGDFRIFYFYDLYIEKGMFESWNFLRDGNVRAFGFVGSKLTLSQMLLIPCSIVLMSILYKKDFFHKLLYSLLGLLLIYGMFITYVRNPFFSLILSFFIFSFFRVFKITWRRYLSLFIIVYLISILTVSYLNDNGSGDSSSQARIPMLLDFLEQIKANPIGYGIGSTGIANKTYPFFYESGAATIFMDLGIVGGTIFWIGIIYISYLSFLKGSNVNNISSKIIYNSMGFSVLTLLLITNFTNIFDFSLIWYSIVIFIIIMYKPYYNS